MNISEHITLEEAIKSQTAIRLGIDNIPNEKQLENMKLTARLCFEPARQHFNVPIGISSFFRCKELNKAIGGSETSQHCEGMAIDIDADIFGKLSNSMIFNFLRYGVNFDQLIWEFGDNNNPDWVHVSFNKDNNRKQILRAIKVKVGDSFKTQYLPFV